MSAWSSAASGKGSALSYAERLRRAKEDSSRSSADSSAAARSSTSSSTPTLTQLSPPPAAPAPPKPASSSSGAWRVVTAHKSANGRADAPNSTSSSSTPSAHPAAASSTIAAASAPAASASASQGKTAAQSPTAASAALRSDALAQRPQPVAAASGVNVWEQRRKQLADKSAESRQETSTAAAAGSKAPVEQKKPVSTTAPPATSTGNASTSASSSAPASAKAAAVAQPPASTRSNGSAPSGASRPGAAESRSSSVGEEDSSKERRAAAPATSASAPAQAGPSAQKPAERRSSTGASLQGDSPITRSIAESTLPFVPRSPLSLARAPTGPAYDNAWLDRIHLLNGGQNMPTFVPALQESSAEMGIGAGLQPAPVVSMPPSLPSTAEEPSATGTPTSAEAHSVWRKANTSVNGAAGDDHQDEVALSASGVSSSVEAAETAAASVPSSAAPASSTVAESSARRRADSTSSGGAVKPAAPAATSKSKARRAQAAASVLADSESWPSPLDATVKTAARSKPRAESVSTGENSSSERPAATEKGLEGLDVQVAKGAGDKGKKGKQWISIVPTITHASPLPASGRKTSGKDAASKDASSATSPHPKKAAKTRADKGAAGGEKRPEADKQDAKSGTKESSKASRQDASAPSAAADSVLASGQGQAREAEASLSAPGAPPAEAADSSGAPDAVSASPALNGETDASAPVALPFSSPLMPMALSELPAMFPPMRWTSGSPGPPSPFPFVPPPPQRLNKDGSFSPTRATDFLVPNGDPSWHASHSPVRHSARGRGSRGRGRGGRHAGGDVFSGSRNDGAYMPGPGADGADLDSQGAPSSRGSPGSGSYATGAQLPFWLHGGQPHALPVFQPQGMAPASLAHGEWQQPPPTRAPAFVNSPAGSPRVPGIDAPTHQLLKQIEFYFSERNLQGDFFLRQCMDAHGWVSISTVAGFNRVQRLTSDLALVRDTLLYSSVLEVDASNMRVRKAQNWESYVLGANGVPNDVDQSSRPSSAQAGISEQHYSSLAQDDASRRHAGLAQLRRQDSAATEGSGVNGYTGESSNADGRSTTTVLTEASRSKSSTAFSSPPSSAAHQDSSMEDGCSDSDKEDQETLGVVAAEGLGGTLFPPVSNGA